MMTKTFLLKLNDMTARAIRAIVIAIPCFISVTETPNFPRCGAYTIEAHAEDWKFVERILTPVM